jgi:anti-sigma factor RsiW
MTQTSNNQTIEQLLPFYLNGTLDSAEKSQVKQALKQDLHLQQELALLQKLQQQTKQQAIPISPGEMGMKRLQRSFKDEPNLASPKTTPSKAWQFTAIAASLLLVVQTATTLLPSGQYQAAGGDTHLQRQGFTIAATFSLDVSEQQIRQLLIQHQIVIIDGPSALGVYHLLVTHKPNDTLEQLKLRQDIFDSIQLE